MDCPLLRFTYGFVDLTVQKLQREQRLEIWPTSSSELGMFVTRNVLRGRRCRRKLRRPMTGDIAEYKSVNTSSQSGTWNPKIHCVANFALRTE